MQISWPYLRWGKTTPKKTSSSLQRVLGSKSHPHHASCTLDANTELLSKFQCTSRESCYIQTFKQEALALHERPKHVSHMEGGAKINWQRTTTRLLSNVCRLCARLCALGLPLLSRWQQFKFPRNTIANRCVFKSQDANRKSCRRFCRKTGKIVGWNRKPMCFGIVIAMSLAFEEVKTNQGSQIFKNRKPPLSLFGGRGGLRFWVAMFPCFRNRSVCGFQGFCWLPCARSSKLNGQTADHHVEDRSLTLRVAVDQTPWINQQLKEMRGLLYDIWSALQVTLERSECKHWSSHTSEDTTDTWGWSCHMSRDIQQSLAAVLDLYNGEWERSPWHAPLHPQSMRIQLTLKSPLLIQKRHINHAALLIIVGPPQHAWSNAPPLSWRDPQSIPVSWQAQRCLNLLVESWVACQWMDKTGGDSGLVIQILASSFVSRLWLKWRYGCFGAMFWKS